MIFVMIFYWCLKNSAPLVIVRSLWWQMVFKENVEKMLLTKDDGLYRDVTGCEGEEEGPSQHLHLQSLPLMHLCLPGKNPTFWMSDAFSKNMFISLINFPKRIFLPSVKIYLFCLSIFQNIK